MPTPSFVPLTIAEFRELVTRYPFQRRITAVHMHHTWRPRHRDYAGHASILGMWRYHTQELRWSDIAQHVTIAPDGTIWTGRSWDAPPASSVGHNGDTQAGPFMFEMIGDFDTGQDTLEGPQREAVVAVIVAVQRRHGLEPETLRFHRDLGSPKTCPGQGIDFAAFVEECRGAHGVAAEGPASRPRAARRPSALPRHAPRSAEGVGAALRALRPRGRRRIERDAEDDHSGAVRRARREEGPPAPAARTTPPGRRRRNATRKGRPRGRRAPAPRKRQRARERRSGKGR